MCGFPGFTILCPSQSGPSSHLCCLSPPPALVLLLSLPVSLCKPHASHSPLQISAPATPTPQENPFSLLQTPDRTAFIPVHLSMGLPGFPCHELGCILPHSSVCYVIWACAPVSWDGGGAFPHPWLPTCYLYTGGPLAGSPLYRIGSACDRAAGVLALEASREARFVPLGSDVCQTLTRGQDQLPMSPGLSVIYRCVTLRLKTTVISLSSQNLVA